MKALCLTLVFALSAFDSGSVHAEEEGWSEWQPLTDADGVATTIRWRARHDTHNSSKAKKGHPAESWDVDFDNTGAAQIRFGFKLTAAELAPRVIGEFGMTMRLDPGAKKQSVAYNNATKGQPSSTSSEGAFSRSSRSVTVNAARSPRPSAPLTASRRPRPQAFAASGCLPAP